LRDLGIDKSVILYITNDFKKQDVNTLNAGLNPICHFLALGAHHIIHVGKIRVNAVAVDKG
jgi:hypothetical protein